MAAWELPHQVELRQGCGNVAGTRYLAPGTWLVEARVLWLRPQALRASSACPATIQKPWFFSVAGTKGLPATVPKPWFVSKTEFMSFEEYVGPVDY